MTGYGRGEASIPGGRVTAEMRSVNHRYGEVVIRLPRALSPLEERVRAAVKDRINRGRVEVFLNLDLETGGRQVKVDRQLAMAYHGVLREIRELLDLEDPISLGDLLALPELVSLSELEVDLERVWPGLSSAVHQALDALSAMREREGAALHRELAQRVENIAGLLQDTVDRSGSVVEAYRRKLESRLAQLLDGAALDEQRLAMEVALLAERSNIAEELVRMDSHLEQCRSALESPEPVGRRLEFLTQELHREINTIASKSADVGLSRLVVALKSEVEKIREQVQNIE